MRAPSIRWLRTGPVMLGSCLDGQRQAASPGRLRCCQERPGPTHATAQAPAWTPALLGPQSWGCVDLAAGQRAVLSRPVLQVAARCP